MKKEFWLQKWQQNQIGFHQNQVNQSLKRYFEVLELKVGDTVFVPLCGKALDLLWLGEQGINVVAVELSETATRDFFTENKLNFKVEKHEEFKVFISDNIKLYQGDFFTLNREHLDQVDAVYDRAALVALPPALRKKYTQHLQYIVPEGSKELLIALEMDRTIADAGPPFSLSDSHIEALFRNSPACVKIASVNLIEFEDHFVQQGCSYFYEKTFLIDY